MKTMGLLVFVFVAKLALQLRPEQGGGGDGKTDVFELEDCFIQIGRRCNGSKMEYSEALWTNRIAS